MLPVQEGLPKRIAVQAGRIRNLHERLDIADVFSLLEVGAEDGLVIFIQFVLFACELTAEQRKTLDAELIALQGLYLASIDAGKLKRAASSEGHAQALARAAGNPRLYAARFEMYDLSWAEMARKVQAKARADKAKAEIGATIIKTDKGPVIDGTAEDQWDRAREYKISNVIYSPISSPDDFAASYRAMWDEENLYVLVDVTDDELENYTDQWYLDDCIEVFIDADNSKSENFGDNDYQYHFDWDASNPQMDEAKHHKIEGVEFAMVTTEKGYRTEIKFPWSTLGTKPSAGVKIGFEVHVNDDDDGERTKLSWRGKSDVASGNPQTWGTADLAGLLGWWKFDNNTEDSSGTGNHGTVNGGPNWVAGQIGDALEFDGIDDYVQIPDDRAVLELTGDYTFSVWVKADATQKIWAGIFSKCDPSGSVNHWTLQFDTSSPKNLLIHHPDPGFWNTGIRLPDIAGATHHIGIVRSGNIMTSYLDGVPRNTGTWNGNPGSGHGHLNIGADRTTMSDYVYKGLIDDVRIYNYVLSDAEIKALANK